MKKMKYGHTQVCLFCTFFKKNQSIMNPIGGSDVQNDHLR